MRTELRLDQVSQNKQYIYRDRPSSKIQKLR